MEKANKKKVRPSPTPLPILSPPTQGQTTAIQSPSPQHPSPPKNNNTQQVGDPFHPDSEQGPQVSKEQLDRILRYIELGKQEGATLGTGGGRYGEQGYYVQPTVFHVRFFCVAVCGLGGGGGWRGPYIRHAYGD